MHSFAEQGEAGMREPGVGSLCRSMPFHVERYDGHERKHLERA